MENNPAMGNNPAKGNNPIEDTLLLHDIVRCVDNKTRNYERTNIYYYDEFYELVISFPFKS